MTGFLGHSPDGQITTLGRGGSDLTATVIGSAMGVDEVQASEITSKYSSVRTETRKMEWPSLLKVISH